MKKNIQKTSLYPQEDRLELLRLFRVAVASQSDIDSIWTLYKRYVNEKAAPYRLNCKCSTSIQSYYQQLQEWYSKNADKFE